jgi:multidrug efflux system membrane fusion protein
VTITQVKPIFVTFTLPQANTDQIRARQAASDGGLVVIAYAADARTELARGKLTLIDNQIASTTGTLRLKGTFENADQRLWPGQFVAVRLVLSIRDGAIVVPQRTVLRGADDSFVYVVKPDRTAERRTVEVAGTQDGLAIIAKGLAVGEIVVVDGEYRLTDGARIAVDAHPSGTPPQRPSAFPTARLRD